MTKLEKSTIKFCDTDWSDSLHGLSMLEIVQRWKSLEEFNDMGWQIDTASRIVAAGVELIKNVREIRPRFPNIIIIIGFSHWELVGSLK